jgi:isoleucyl-tRNA synthetase
LDSNDVVITAKTPDGWAGLADRNTQVLLDARITAELAREGTAREIVRHVQELRKKAGLEMQDRIRLHFETDSLTIRHAIESHESYICGETLATELTSQPLDGAACRAVIKLQGEPLTVELDKTSFRAPAEES